MNGFYMNLVLSEEEKELCYKFLGCGPLGMTEEKMSRLSSLEKEKIQNLFEEGMVWKLPLYDWAKMFVEKESAMYADLQEVGGFIEVNKTDKNFIRSYDRALKIIGEGRIPKNQKIYFQMMPILYDYANIVWL